MIEGNEDVKTAIICALSHKEAIDGLFLWNFSRLHEEDERPRVDATKEMILNALNELIQEGKVVISEEVDSVVFKLQASQNHTQSAISA